MTVKQVLNQIHNISPVTYIFKKVDIYICFFGLSLLGSYLENKMNIVKVKTKDKIKI